MEKYAVRILGLDPGIAIVGWGVIDSANFKYKPVAYDSIMTASGLEVEERLSQIYDALSNVIETYRPEVMAVEELFWNTNQKTGIVVAEARGVILLCAKRHGLPIFEYTPLQVKQSVVGYGRAEKRQVIAMVTALLKLPKPPKPDDTADALALAVCHANVGASPLSKYYKM